MGQINFLSKPIPTTNGYECIELQELRIMSSDEAVALSNGNWSDVGLGPSGLGFPVSLVASIFFSL